MSYLTGYSFEERWIIIKWLIVNVTVGIWIFSHTNDLPTFTKDLMLPDKNSLGSSNNTLVSFNYMHVIFFYFPNVSFRFNGLSSRTFILLSGCVYGLCKTWKILAVTHMNFLTVDENNTLTLVIKFKVVLKATSRKSQEPFVFLFNYL